MRLIDADRLLMHLSDYALQESPWWGANGYGNKDAYEAIEECIKAVEEAPTVDAVEVVHGEWNKIEIIDDDSGNGVNDDASQCSVCGDVFDSYYWAKTYFNYCPNCGAKMTMYKKTDVTLLNESASWLVTDEDVNIATCSNCHRRVHICNAVIFNFCPFCGMRIGNREGEADETD